MVDKEKVTLDDLRCDDCAFREGTEANKSEWTKLKAQICAEIPCEFECHRRPGPCAGWAALCNKLNAEGYYAQQPPWRQHLKVAILEGMHRVEDGEQVNVTDLVEAAMRKPE